MPDGEVDLALVQDGVVVVVARYPAEPSSFGESPFGDIVQLPASAALPGMLWDGHTLSLAPPPPPPPPTVPRSVSMRQARLELLATPSPAGNGQTLLDVVTAYIATQPQATQIEWQFATDVWRDRDLVAGIGTTLGLTDAQIDALFIAAAAIP